MGILLVFLETIRDTKPINVPITAEPQMLLLTVFEKQANTAN